MNQATRRSIIFASKTTVAALAALLTALWFQLPNPGWAAVTVFLTSQQLGAISGSVVSRSLYRVLGTLLAAAGILLLIPMLNATPETLILGTAAWVALLLFLSMLDRGPRSYLFLLAAYTLPLIGLPLANSPLSAFDAALGRVEEVTLGVIFSIAVHSVIAPRDVRPVLIARFRSTIDNARRWLLLGLGADDPDQASTRTARGRAVAELAEARTLASLLRFDPGIAPRDLTLVTALEERLPALLPLLAGVEERLQVASAADSRLMPRIDRHREAVRRHLELSHDRRDTERLATAGRELVPKGSTRLQDGPLLLLGAMERLAELLHAWDDCLALMRQLETPSGAPDPSLRELVARASARILHIDYGIAAMSGLAAASAVTAAGAVCWALGWDQGIITVGLAAVGSCLFAFLDDPRPFLKSMLMMTLLAVPVAALYVFAIFPALGGYLELAMVLAPVFFISAYLLSIPRWSVPAIGFFLSVVTLIAIQPLQSGGDFGSFIATSIGAVFGVSIALASTSLTRVVSVATSVRRIMHAAWRDLAAIARGQPGHTRAQWGSRMTDRIGLLMPRLAATQGVMRDRAQRALEDLRVGVNLLDLRDTSLHAAAPLRTAIDSALDQISEHFRQRMGNPDAAPAPNARLAIGQVIAGLAEAAPGPQRTRALAAATGLQLALFPPGVSSVQAIQESEGDGRDRRN